MMRSTGRIQAHERPGAGTELVRLDAQPLEHGHIEVAQRRWLVVGLYVILFLAALAIAAFLRQSLRLPKDEPSDDALGLSPYEVAYLAGGEELAASGVTIRSHHLPSPPNLVLALGLFGMGILAGGPLAELQTALKPPPGRFWCIMDADKDRTGIPQRLLYTTPVPTPREGEVLDLRLSFGIGGPSARNGKSKWVWIGKYRFVSEAPSEKTIVGKQKVGNLC